jgi:hypothetical protein
VTALALTPMVGVQTVLDAVQTVLEQNLGVYVQELFARTQLLLPSDVEVLQVPLFEIDALAAADTLTLPSIALSSPGLAGSASRSEGGLYDATWEIVVTSVSRGETAADTSRQARAWGLAIRTCLLANSTLGGLGSLTWVDESYAPLPVKSSRTLGGAIVVFHVDVDGVAAHGRASGTPVTGTFLDVTGFGPTHPALVEGT